jgi:hypothetical protein
MNASRDVGLAGLISVGSVHQGQIENYVPNLPVELVLVDIPKQNIIRIKYD